MLTLRLSDVETLIFETFLMAFKPRLFMRWDFWIPLLNWRFL